MRTRLVMVMLAVVGGGAWPMTAMADQAARGVVFEDQNRNGQRDAGEPGLANMLVSNGELITQTDADGRYRLPVDDGTVLFVIKPRDWMTPVSDHQIPQFHYVHRPEGSPELRYGGIAPTGPLPDSIDFALHRRPEPEKFEVLFFGDTQPSTQKQIDYIAHDVVEELIDYPAAFGVTLGDIMNDDLSLFESLNRTIAHIGAPWYNVLGNHDIDFDVQEDALSTETFKNVFGPPYYAFNYGPVHFVVLDNVAYEGEQNFRRYHAELGEKQLAWLERDLETVSKDQLVVLMFHIPLWQIRDLQQLFNLLEPFEHNFSIAAHYHVHRTHFIDSNYDFGERGPKQWNQKQPHNHLVAGTVSGSWWRGVPDEQGIPHTTMRDGTPNGYIIATFDGSQYRWRYKAARRPADFQMLAHTPEAVSRAALGETPVQVNVFNGSEKTKVRMRVRGSGSWAAMERVDAPDPYYVATKEREQRLGEMLPDWPRAELGPTLPGIANSTHMWRAMLPSGLAAGSHLIEFEAEDRWGETHRGKRIFRVTE